MKRWKIWLVMTVVVMAAVGCGKKPSEAVTEVVQQESEGKISEKTENDSGLEEYRKACLANRRVAKSALKYLHKPGENLVFSPYSLFRAVTTLGNGLEEGERRKLMELLYENPEQSIDSMNNGVNSMLLSMVEKEDGFRNRNRFLYSKELKLKENQRRTLSEILGTDIYRVDFSQGEKVQKVLNEMVKEDTAGMIQNFMQTPPLAQTNSCILDTVYLNAAWSNEFNEANTKELPFYGIREKKNVPMMTKIETLGTKKTERGTEVEIPYMNGMRLHILMPESADDMSGALTDLLMEESGNETSWKTFLVTLTLPKFELKQSADLREYLDSVGIIQKGSKNTFFETPPVKESFMARQDAVIRVHEKGTEAAAATVIADEKSDAGEVPEEMTLVLDHPFVFTVESGDNVLFAGIVEQLQ